MCYYSWMRFIFDFYCSSPVIIRVLSFSPFSLVLNLGNPTQLHIPKATVQRRLQENNRNSDALWTFKQQLVYKMRVRYVKVTIANFGISHTFVTLNTFLRPYKFFTFCHIACCRLLKHLLFKYSKSETKPFNMILTLIILVTQGWYRLDFTESNLVTCSTSIRFWHFGTYRFHSI